jgi:hypothetical protein
MRQVSFYRFATRSQAKQIEYMGEIFLACASYAESGGKVAHGQQFDLKHVGDAKLPMGNFLKIVVSKLLERVQDSTFAKRFINFDLEP